MTGHRSTRQSRCPKCGGPTAVWSEHRPGCPEGVEVNSGNRATQRPLWRFRFASRLAFVHLEIPGTTITASGKLVRSNTRRIVVLQREPLL